MIKKIFRMECARRKYHTLLLTIASTLAILVFAYGNLYDYVYQYQIDVWEQAGQIFSMLFPLICMLCVGNMLYDDRRNGYLDYIRVRMPEKKYLAGKKAACVILSFFFAFAVSFFSFAVIILFFPKVGGLHQSYQSGAFQHVLGNWYTGYPSGYALALSLWRGAIGGIIVNFGFHLSKYVNNKVVLIVGPFVLVMLLHFVLAVAQIPQYSVIYSFEPSGLVSHAITPWSVLLGPAQFLIFSFITEAAGKYYEHHSVNGKKNPSEFVSY